MSAKPTAETISRHMSFVLTSQARDVYLETGITPRQLAEQHAKLLTEHAEWAKAFGFALVRARQADYAPTLNLARSFLIEFPGGKPSLKSAALAKMKGDTK